MEQLPGDSLSRSKTRHLGSHARPRGRDGPDAPSSPLGRAHRLSRTPVSRSRPGALESCARPFPFGAAPMSHLASLRRPQADATIDDPRWRADLHLTPNVGVSRLGLAHPLACCRSGPGAIQGHARSLPRSKRVRPGPAAIGVGRRCAHTAYTATPPVHAQVVASRSYLDAMVRPTAMVEVAYRASAPGRRQCIE